MIWISETREYFKVQTQNQCIRFIRANQGCKENLHLNFFHYVLQKVYTIPINEFTTYYYHINII